MSVTASLLSEVNQALEQSSRAPELETDPELQTFIKYFCEKFGSNLVAVIFFGSFLSSVTRKQSSFRDFFVILDTYKSAGGGFERLMHRVLPPDLYRVTLKMPDGSASECKYYLLSVDHLIKTTGPEAPDMYVLGRLSKQVACVYQRNQAAKMLVARCLASAAEMAFRYAAAIMDRPMQKQELFKLVLQLSYMAERRLEDERKIEELFNAGEHYYNRVYGELLERLVQEGLSQSMPDGRYRRTPGTEGITRGQARRFLKRSRRRAKLRWPKMIITVDNWMDYLIAKLERTHGVKIDLPDWERKTWFITGWRHYIKLKRQGKIR